MGSNAASSFRSSTQVRWSEFDAFNVCGGVDGHLKHGTAFRRVGKVGIGLIQRTFEHARSIAWSVSCVCAHTYSVPVHLR